jgi:hypothetical protein
MEIIGGMATCVLSGRYEAEGDALWFELIETPDMSATCYIFMANYGKAEKHRRRQMKNTSGKENLSRGKENRAHLNGHSL